MSESKLAGRLAGPVRELDLSFKFEDKGPAGQEAEFARKCLGPDEARELAAWLSDTPGASEALKVLDLSGNEELAADEGKLEALFAALKACAIERLDISGAGLGPEGLTLFAAVLAPDTSFSAAIKSINMHSNTCFGLRKSRDGTREHDMDEDQTGWRAFCEALKGTTIEILGVANIGAGPVALSTLADAITAMAAITSLNVIKNLIGDDGLAALMTAVKGTNIKSITILMSVF
jgi:hypothetical protein